MTAVRVDQPVHHYGAMNTAIDVHAITSGVGSVRVGAHHTDVAVYAAAAGAADASSRATSSHVEKVSVANPTGR